MTITAAERVSPPPESPHRTAGDQLGSRPGSPRHCGKSKGLRWQSTVRRRRRDREVYTAKRSRIKHLLHEEPEEKKTNDLAFDSSRVGLPKGAVR